MLDKSRAKTATGQIVFVLYTMVYLIIAILPMFKYSVPYVVAGSVGLFYALLVFIKYDKYRFIIILFVFLGTLEGTLLFANGGREADIINEPIRVLRCIIPCFICGDLCKISRTLKTVLWLFLSALLLYVAINTLLELGQNDMIARSLANGNTDEDLTQYRMQNIGGFEFSYAFGLTFPLWLVLFIKSKNFVLKIIWLIAAVFVAYYVISAQYMILFLLCVLSLLVILATNPKKLYLKIINVAVILILLGFASTIFRWIANFDIGSMMQSRLNHLADFFDGKINIEDTSSRWELYKNSLNAFLEHPLIGSYVSQAALDSHSWLLGVGASTGIIGICCMIAELVVYFKLNKTMFIRNRLNLNSFIIAYVIFIVLLVFNPIQYAYEIFIALFLYIPLTLNLFYKNTGKDYEIVSKNSKIHV